MKTLVLFKDLSRSGCAADIFSEVKKRRIDVNVLVNNAGFGDLSPIAEADLDVQRHMMQVNISVLVELTRLFLPEMTHLHSGRILNIASVGFFSPVPYMAAYAASKAFVRSFSEALGAELDGSGVTVTASCPGVTSTQ